MSLATRSLDVDLLYLASSSMRIKVERKVSLSTDLKMRQMR